MAIAKEKLLEILNGETDVETKASSIISIVDEDVNSQLNAIKVNKEEILAEKREEAAKRKALEEQFATLKEKSQQLEEQLKNNSPDEVKKIYDQRLNEAQVIHERRANELQATIQEKEAEIETLKKSQLKLECMEAFNKAIANKNIAPDTINEFSEFVLGQDCYKFDHRPIGDGQYILATKEGLTIDAAVKAALETTFGKRCVIAGNSGGGAEGGTGTSTAVTHNPFKKETFSLTEQGILFRENPEEYKRLKALAGL